MFNNYYNKTNKKIKTLKYELCNNEYNLKYSDIEIYEIYLKAFNKLCYDKYSYIDKRLCLFSTNNFEEMRNLVSNEKDTKILKELERLSMDENFIDDYDYEHVQKKLMNSIRYEGYEEGYEKGVEEGIKEGIEKGIKENSTGIAKRMLLKDIDINTISSITNLDIEEINKLKLEM